MGPQWRETADWALADLLSRFWDKEQGRPVLDEEIGDAVRLTRGGEIVNERIKG